MKTLCKALCVVLLCALSAACNSDQKESGAVTSARIRIKATTATFSTLTKASTEPSAVVGEMEYSTSGHFTVSQSMLPMEGSAIDDVTETKSSIVDAGLLKTKGNSFALSAYFEQADRKLWQDPTSIFFQNQKVTRGTTSWGMSEDFYWRRDVYTNFWAQYPETLAAGDGSLSVSLPGEDATDAEEKTIAFTYSRPAASSPTDWHDAQHGEDILFAYAREKFSSGKTLGMEFHHALCAVRFDVSGVAVSGLEVVGVSFRNIYSSADCSVASNGGNLVFDWYNQAAKTSYSQNATDSDPVFFMIPQTIPSDAEIALTFRRSEGTVQEVSMPLNSFASSWNTGYLYTYTISYTTEDGIGISLDDNMAGKVKSNLTITNTGNVKSYVRAILVGAWYDDAHNVVAGWDSSDASQGSFAGFNSSDWTLGTDGFYYCRNAVAAGAAAPVLFTTYTASEASVSGAHLEMTIVSQCVKYDVSKQNVSNAWGATAASYLN